MPSEYFRIVSTVNDLRLDQFLADQMEGFSRNRLQALIKDGKITVSKKLRKSSYRLCEGDEIEGEIPPLEYTEIKPMDIPLDIVYEDSDVIVINKPKNMVVHPAPGHFDDTLVNALLFHCKDELSGINGTVRPGIVHRIDKNTTGLLVCAKTNEAHISLSQQLQEHSIKRIYHAIVFGNLKDDSGTIDLPIARNPKDRLKMCIDQQNGKKAVTHFNVEKRYGKYTHIQVRLETGRTHQIRVHLAHLGFPVLGDDVYTGRTQPFKTHGQVLHAKSLSFIHPRTKETLTLDCELPKYFTELLLKL